MLTSALDRPDDMQDITAALCALWHEMLDVEVRADDDVFDLGCSSLLVVEAVAVARNRGIQLRAIDVFTNPTPAAQAHLVVGPVEARADVPAAPQHDLVAAVCREGPHPGAPGVPSPMRALIADGVGEPLYCVHAGGGNVVFLDANRAACELLRAGRSLYVLESPANSTRVRPLLSIAEIADLYVTAIREVQPHGPYHLTGFCSGGLIAFEIARRLRARSEQVPSLILVGATGEPGLDPGWGLTDCYDHLLDMVQDRFGLLDPVADLPVTVARMIERQAFEPGVTAADFHRRMVHWAAGLFAQEHYIPQSYDGPVTICMYKQFDVRDYWQAIVPHARIVACNAVTAAGLATDPMVVAEHRRQLG